MLEADHGRLILIIIIIIIITIIITTTTITILHFNEGDINKRFPLDVMAAILVHRTKEKKDFREYYSTIMQNMCHHLPLFCASTWPSYHMIENHLYCCLMMPLIENQLYR